MNVVILCIDKGEQLRYALRSLDKCKGVDRVVLVGTRPNWYKGEFLEHLGGGNNLRDMAQKLLVAMNYLNDEPFMFCSDDTYFLESTDLNKLPLYRCKQSFSERMKGHVEDAYWKQLRNTLFWLKQNGYKDVCFEAHQPIPIRETSLMREICEFNLSAPQPLLIKSLYGARLGQKSVAMPNCKISNEVDEIKGKFVSTNDRSFAGKVGDYLREKFNEKSRHEL